MRWISAAIVLSWIVAGCGGVQDEASAEGGTASEEVREVTGPDPCGLVSAAEMEAMIGPLREPPFRVDHRRQPDPGGEGCFYRARDGHNVTILADWESGTMGFQMMAGSGTEFGDILYGYDAATDTLEGNWDKVGYVYGQFIALKDSVSVQVDPLGSNIGLPGAAHLTALAIGRLDSPLDYDGAKATRARPASRPVDRNPCDLVTREEAEALMGPLLEDPRPSEDGTGCEFPTDKEMFGEPVVYTLEVQWTDGFHALGEERTAIGSAERAMAVHVDPDMPALSEEGAGESEPWDERITLLGGVVAVVKDDALLRMANGGGAFDFDDSELLELLRIAANRL